VAPAKGGKWEPCDPNIMFHSHFSWHVHVGTKFESQGTEKTLALPRERQMIVAKLLRFYWLSESGETSVWT